MFNIVYIYFIYKYLYIILYILYYIYYISEGNSINSLKIRFNYLKLTQTHKRRVYGRSPFLNEELVFLHINSLLIF